MLLHPQPPSPVFQSGTSAVLRWTVTNGASCPTTQADVTLTNTAPTTIANLAGPASIEQCNVSTFTMSANTATVGTGAWSIVSGAASITSTGLPNTTVTVAAGNTATLRWTITNAPCGPTFDDIILTNYAPASASVAGSNINQCNTSTFTMAATAPDGHRFVERSERHGCNYQWYFSYNYHYGCSFGHEVLCFGGRLPMVHPVLLTLRSPTQRLPR